MRQLSCLAAKAPVRVPTVVPVGQVQQRGAVARPRDGLARQQARLSVVAVLLDFRTGGTRPRRQRGDLPEGVVLDPVEQLLNGRV